MSTLEFNLLGEAGYTGTLNDRRKQFYLAEGYDNEYTYLKSFGYTGTVNDMRYQHAIANGLSGISELIRTGGLVAYAGGIPEVSAVFPTNADRLTYTQVTPTDTTTWTMSFWFKTSASTEQHLYHGADSGGFCMGRLETSGSLTLRFGQSGTGLDSITIAGAYNDDTWYHMVIAVDNALGTAADRLKIWINGSSIAYTGSLTSGRVMDINQASETFHIGTEGTNTLNDFEGNIYNFIFVDGQQLAHTDFGESAGTWVPIAYEGTYGANGFNLTFENASNLGEDSSGNGNNFTNVSAVTQSTTVYPTA